jgi:excisionase family DNA binding protein
MSSPFLEALIGELERDPSARARIAPLLAPHMADLLPKPTADDGYLDSKAAAAYLSCGTGRIRNLVHEGRLTARKDGTRLLFTRADLDAHLKTTGDPA